MTVSIITILFVLGVAGHITYVERRIRKAQRNCTHEWQYQETDYTPKFMKSHKFQAVKIQCPNCSKHREVSHHTYRMMVIRGEVTALPKK